MEIIAPGAVRRVLVTGGTGTLGAAIVRRCLALGYERIVVFSRSESRQATLQGELGDHPALRFFIGDVRDRERLIHAFYHVDAVIHTAALKRVDAMAYNPDEVRKTNIEGSANVIAAAAEAGVSKVLMISSDKAVSPMNVYGVSKAQMEHEAIASNALTWPRGTAIACTRWGNVLGSTGSVIQLWRAQRAAGKPLTLTEPEMTRFWLTADQAVSVVLEALYRMEGGEIFVPECPAMRLGDLAHAFAPGHATEVIGLRPGGEKLHEELWTSEEGPRTVYDDGLYIIRPSLHPWRGDTPWVGIAAPKTYRSDLVPRVTIAEMARWLESV